MYLSLTSKQRVLPVASIFVCLFSLSSSASSIDEIAQRLPPAITYVLLDEGEPGDEGDVIPDFSSGSFLESDGLMVIDIESLNAPQDWVLKTGDGAIGGYLEWDGSNSFDSPGNGLISMKVAISNPGTYRFLWRSSFREGTNPTESNDSWLRIFADNFYGYRSRDNSTVCPSGQPSSNRCIGREPNGSSRDGWLKIYRSGGDALSWDWMSNTSDDDAHQIYVDFDAIGEYEIQISGRSQHHAIDRLVLFRDLNDNDNILQNDATDSTWLESITVP